MAKGQHLVSLLRTLPKRSAGKEKACSDRWEGLVRVRLSREELGWRRTRLSPLGGTLSNRRASRLFLMPGCGHPCDSFLPLGRYSNSYRLPEAWKITFTLPPTRGSPAPSALRSEQLLSFSYFSFSHSSSSLGLLPCRNPWISWEFSQDQARPLSTSSVIRGGHSSSTGTPS
ncbi:hypothetical protein IE53DRAFT_64732 [Violaceomyces palustris]|uniref:Uncharacterized protein n=1 Tax=Violaceomyces palustris TaxID=1673888 RepID=A0ACD0P752_9BASI|nr:hypothetical protein IE53DRAFT_64732 [Violaceomyces palustris]